MIEPHYPKSGKVGRPPIGVARMLRMYFLQQRYTLADEALEDALYDSQAMREFVGIELGRENVPDATTLLKFRRLLEQTDLTGAMLVEVNAHLSERGLLMRQGTLVDATIIAAPSSTKNEAGKRDPEMHQAKKGNQWHFGMMLVAARKRCFPALRTRFRDLLVFGSWSHPCLAARRAARHGRTLRWGGQGGRLR